MVLPVCDVIKNYALENNESKINSKSGQLLLKNIMVIKI